MADVEKKGDLIEDDRRSTNSKRSHNAVTAAVTSPAEVSAPSTSSYSGINLTWKEIHCTIEAGGALEKKVTVQALKGVSGFAKPGQALAILGASGAGKSTLTDILSHRKTFGNISGDVLLNGRPGDIFYQKRLGYVTYDMSHTPTLTVRETLMLAAEFRMPASSSHADRVAMVDRTIAGLKLDKCADTRVGDELLRGLSSGEKKRLEVGIELVASPKIIFLDEPTSGLDDHGARFTMELILKYARTENLTVIVVIHQPSKYVIELFDQIMILGAGKVCYFGPYAKAEEYYSNHLQRPTPEFTNPIEHYLDVIIENPESAITAYQGSELKKEMDAELEVLSDPKIQPPVQQHSTNLYERGFVDQFKLLIVRVWKRYMRNPSTSFGRVFVSVLLLFIYGAVFWKVESNITGLRNRTSLASVMAFIPAFVAGSAAPQFLEDRDLYIQENKAGFYQLPAYFLSYFVVEVFLITITTAIQTVILFFMANLDTATFAPFFGMIIVQGIVTVAVTQFVSAWSRTLTQAYTSLVSYGLVLFLFSGPQVNLNTLPAWLKWIPKVDYWAFSVQYLLWRTVSTVEIECDTALVTLNMNEIIETVTAAVKKTVYSNLLSIPNATDAQAASAINALAAISSISTFNSSVLPLANLPADALATVQGALAANIQGLITLFPLAGGNASLPLSNPNVLASAVASAGGAALFNNTEALSASNAFPNYTFCAIGDAKTFIYQHYGVSEDGGHDDRYGYMVLWLLFHMVLGYAGLEFAKRFKKR
ncbi:hypothetical protein DFJ73DRAFT_638392 [Zopfochytrium polystomum]|nr:hypothetical protein DFJ73DRAFT_638392 [Zopfochytrium polystomum]